MSSKRLAVYVVVFVAAVGAYGWWWQDKATALSKGYASLSSDLLPEGTQVTYTITDTGGFPFRIYHKLSDVSINVPDYGQVTFEALELIHQPWTKGHMMLHFEGLVRRMDTDGAILWSASASKNLASLVGRGTGNIAFDLDLRGLKGAQGDGGGDIPALQYHAKTKGYYGDSSTEVVMVTKTEGVIPLF
jgi:hypothetical protein